MGEGEPRVRFVAEDGNAIEIVLRREIIDSFQGVDLLQRARELERIPEEELFEWTTLSL